MHKEFHYYITYLIAVKAGFEPRQASTLAYASQYVDDNDKVFKINQDSSTSSYQNYISQTMDITKPKAELKRIYPLFHFIPGDYETYNQKLEEDCPDFNTTPDSEHANQIMDRALETDNIYRIGIACHAYADTWAHQNFVGIENDFNAFEELADRLFPNIGHADAGHDPDIPDLVWEDNRLIEPEVDNKRRFLEATGRIFAKLKRYFTSNTSEQSLKTEKECLLEDLDQIITEYDTKRERIKAYQQLALQDEYGGAKIPAYDEYYWFDQAVKEEPPEIEIDLFIKEFHPLEPLDGYHWKDSNNYEQTDWFKFQEAVKDHQQETTDILEPVLADKEVENW